MSSITEFRKGVILIYSKIVCTKVAIVTTEKKLQKYANILNKVAFAHLSTILPDGAPHTSPLWFSFENNLFMINTPVGSLKDRNMRRKGIQSFLEGVQEKKEVMKENTLPFSHKSNKVEGNGNLGQHILKNQVKSRIRFR